MACHETLGRTDNSARREADALAKWQLDNVAPRSIIVLKLDLQRVACQIFVGCSIQGRPCSNHSTSGAGETRNIRHVQTISSTHIHGDASISLCARVLHKSKAHIRWPADAVVVDKLHKMMHAISAKNSSTGRVKH